MSLFVLGKRLQDPSVRNKPSEEDVSRLCHRLYSFLVHSTLGSEGTYWDLCVLSVKEEDSESKGWTFHPDHHGWCVLILLRCSDTSIFIIQATVDDMTINN